MFDLGLAIDAGRVPLGREAARLLLKAVFSVLIAVPAIALVVTRRDRSAACGRDRHRADGDLPGAPVALRRSMGAGGHPDVRACAADLGGVARGRLDAVSIARPQRILPRAGQSSIRSTWPASLLRPTAAPPARHGDESAGRAASVARTEARGARKWLAARASRAGADRHLAVHRRAGRASALAIALVTALALAAGHVLGGAVEPATRTATAICSAARNPGLAYWSRRSTTLRRRSRPRLSPIC